MSDITASMVLWNEAHRIEPLIARLRPYFEVIAVGVQASTDGTAQLAHDLADIVVTDEWRGYGDATFGPLVLPKVQTPWTFKIDGDELPTEELLQSLPDAVKTASAEGRDGAWIKFRSWIEDAEWEVPHSHLRLFQTRLGWPGTLHSRPNTENTLNWPIGWIEHRKSLDEHVRGYLEYLRVGRGNRGWDEHNRLMIEGACAGTAERKGWAFVQSFDWWPEVLTTVFNDRLPADTALEL